MMLQKRLAGDILKCSAKRVRLEPDRMAEIKEAITRADIKALISEGAIRKIAARGISRARTRKTGSQKRKGRHKGDGSRKGKKTARLKPKRDWINRIRLQREFLINARDKELVTKETFRMLYRKSKGGFFRNKRHVKLYMNEQKLWAGKNEE